MSDKIKLIEEELKRYLLILKSKYPNKRKNDAAIKRDLITIYENIKLDQTVVVGLFDYRNSSIFYLSDNVDTLTYFSRDTILNWGSLLLFKLLDKSHYSIAFSSLKTRFKFQKKIKDDSKVNSIFYGVGIKILDNKNQLRRVFVKGRPLVIDGEGNYDIDVIFVEDISHLIKGDHYWLRFENEENILIHVHQKGKKKFKEIISNRECEILKLIAEKKSTQEIADILNLSRLTIETHRKNMIKRTGAIDSTALIHLCKKANVI